MEDFGIKIESEDRDLFLLTVRGHAVEPNKNTAYVSANLRDLIELRDTLNKIIDAEISYEVRFIA